VVGKSAKIMVLLYNTLFLQKNGGKEYFHPIGAALLFDGKICQSAEQAVTKTLWETPNRYLES